MTLREGKNRQAEDARERDEVLPAHQTGPAARRMEAPDIDSILALASVEPTAPHWPATEYLRMLDVMRALPTRRNAWVVPAEIAEETCPGFSPETGAWILSVSAFAMASHVSGVCDLEAVVVDPRLRRRGLGRVLVNAVLAWARTLGATRVELEVRPSNIAAIRLYEQLGFRTDGLRRRYYRNPEEDAQLMSLTLESATAPE